MSGKNGVIGPRAQVHVARGWKSGLEVAKEVMAHVVQESPQTRPIAMHLLVRAKTPNAPNKRIYWILNIGIGSQKRPEHMLLLWV